MTPGPGSGTRSGPGLGSAPAYITCNCGQSFASLSQLERHMSAEHPENTNLVSRLPERGSILYITFFFQSNIFRLSRIIFTPEMSEREWE